MSSQFEHVDEYGQRYVTTIEKVGAGVQITTETYTPYIYGEQLQVRRLTDSGKLSIEVWGMVTKDVQILGVVDGTTQIIAGGSETELAWIETWNSCSSPIKNEFTHILNCSVTSSVSSSTTSGSAMTDVGINNVVWADVDESGVMSAEPPNKTHISFIDVWS